MDVAAGVRISRILLIAGAALGVQGLTAVFMGYTVLGVIILIAGICMLAVASAFYKFFGLFDLQTSVMRRKKT